MWNAGLDESQVEIMTARRNINSHRTVDDTTLMAETEAELKILWMRVKEESEKAGLTSTFKTKIVASGPIISLQIEREKVEAMTDFIILGSRITADHDCSHEIKRHLLLGSKAMTNLDTVLKKQRNLIANKDLYSQSYGFSSSSHVWM